MTGALAPSHVTPIASTLIPKSNPARKFISSSTISATTSRLMLRNIPVTISTNPARKNGGSAKRIEAATRKVENKSSAQ